MLRTTYFIFINRQKRASNRCDNKFDRNAHFSVILIRKIIALLDSSVILGKKPTQRRLRVQNRFMKISY